MVFSLFFNNCFFAVSNKVLILIVLLPFFNENVQHLNNSSRFFKVSQIFLNVYNLVTQINLLKFLKMAQTSIIEVCQKARGNSK